MSVLDGFLSVWSQARTSFGQGTPQGGEAFDTGDSMKQVQTQLASAAPGSGWTGPAASAYEARNAEHLRKVERFAALDQRMREQIDRATGVVTSGRNNLDAVHKWVTDLAATVPRTTAGERMLLPIVQQGIGQVTDIVSRANADLNSIGTTIRGIGAQYEALGGKDGSDRPQFATGNGDGKGDTDSKTPENPYENALHEAGLLDGKPEGYYREWLENAQRQGVPPEVIVDIARRHNVTPQSFDVLNKMEKVVDKDGKSFFMLPKGMSGEDARKATLMTYILNAGTDYGEGTAHDFEPTPYSADEVQRIIDRQNTNSWTYDQDVDFVHNNGGRLMTTPNGMLMGLGGNELQDLYSEAGGSTWGDIFMLNIDNPDDAAQQLRDVAKSGVMWYPAPDGNGRAGSLDLDRILHHEERHSQQWADKGYGTFLREYGWEMFREKVLGKTNRLEEDAGLSDGGYS